MELSEGLKEMLGLLVKGAETGASTLAGTQQATEPIGEQAGDAAIDKGHELGASPKASAAVATATEMVVDPVNLMPQIKGGAFIGAIAPKVFHSSMELLKKYVSPEILERILSGGTGYKDKSKTILMKPDDFLNYAEHGIDPKKTAAVRKWFGKEKVEHPPTMYISEGKEGNYYNMWGHEGRHRARAFKEAGLEYMPVDIKMDRLRWSEQHDKNLFDYKENFPELFITQRGELDSFPIPRSESTLPNAGK